MLTPLQQGLAIGLLAFILATIGSVPAVYAGALWFTITAMVTLIGTAHASFIRGQGRAFTLAYYRATRDLPMHRGDDYRLSEAA